MIDLYQAAVIVIGFAGLQLMGKGLTYFWDKFTGADEKYVKKSFCKTCEKRGKAEDGRLEQELLVVKGILLMVAIEMKIPIEKIERLMEKGGNNA